MSDLLGANQAETMMRRVSPEGRARAARERRRAQQRRLRLAGGVLIVVLLTLALAGVADIVLGALTPPVIAAITALFVAGLAMTLYRARPRAQNATVLNQTTLTALPGAAAAWLEGHQALLPASAITLADDLASRLHELSPQLSRLKGDEPAADAVRRLLAVELPALVEHHQSVPARLRAAPRDDGASADAHLVNGLRIVDEEVGRLTAQLARGDVDALATQDRFLELKYQGGEGV